MYKFASGFVIFSALINFIFQIVLLLFTAAAGESNESHIYTLLFCTSLLLSLFILYVGFRAQTSKLWIYILFICALVTVGIYMYFFRHLVLIYGATGFYLVVSAGILLLSFPKVNIKNNSQIVAKSKPFISLKGVVIIITSLFILNYLYQLIVMFLLRNP